MERIALIVVDMQRDFVDPEKGSLYVPGAEAIVDTVNKLIDKAIENGWEVVYTQDWHPRDSQFFNTVREDGWPVHCIAGTEGAEIVVKTLI